MQKFRFLLGRSGFWVVGVAWRSNENKGEEGESIAAAKFRMEGEETIGKVRAVMIGYQGTYEGNRFQVKLWLNADTLSPLKRVCTLEKSAGSSTKVTERYTEYSTRDIPDEIFRPR